MPVLAADGCHVTTVEGIGTVKGDNLHPIQKAMTDMHGSQCGTRILGRALHIDTLLGIYYSQSKLVPVLFFFRFLLSL